MTTMNTVCFDVGGAKHKVTRSLVELYPNTMLAKLVSKTWQTDPQKEIYIDRDGTLFSYVLAYMRDKKAYLPLSISKGALMQELHYFGFAEVDAAAIVCNHANLEGAFHVVACRKAYETELREAVTAAEDAKKTELYVRMAFKCFDAISQGRVEKERFSEETVQFDWKTFDLVMRNMNKKRFNQHLAKYGLEYKSHILSSSCVKVTVKVLAN